MCKCTQKTVDKNCVIGMTLSMQSDLAYNSLVIASTLIELRGDVKRLQQQQSKISARYRKHVKESGTNV